MNLKTMMPVLPVLTRPYFFVRVRYCINNQGNGWGVFENQQKFSVTCFIKRRTNAQVLGDRDAFACHRL
jgi:hypothetical protein